MKREPTVLIADDDESIRDVLGVVLPAFGYRTRDAKDGAETLAAARREPVPDAILLDLRMPGLSGEEALRKLKEDPRLARVPVIVMSGDVDARHVARNAGADGCIDKPVDLDVLLRALAGSTAAPRAAAR